MLIFQDALPCIKTFLKPVPLSRRARGLLVRCLVAFLMHLGKMSAAQAAGALRTAFSRLLLRYRIALENEVRETVERDEDVSGELAELRRVLREL